MQHFAAMQKCDGNDGIENAPLWTLIFKAAGTNHDWSAWGEFSIYLVSFHCFS